MPRATISVTSGDDEVDGNDPSPLSAECAGGLVAGQPALSGVDR
jgi:hypothetical protein